MERTFAISFILLGMFEIPYNSHNDYTAWFVLAIITLSVKPFIEWIGKILNRKD